MFSLPPGAEPRSPAESWGESFCGVHVLRKELGKVAFPSLEAVSDTWHTPRAEGDASWTLGTGFPTAPEELVLGIVINRQWQEAAGSVGLDKYINSGKLGGYQILLQRFQVLSHSLPRLPQDWWVGVAVRIMYTLRMCSACVYFRAQI